MTSRGQQLLDEVAAADAAEAAVWADYDATLAANRPGLAEPAGGMSKADSDAFMARLGQAQAVRQAARDALYAYFEGPDASPAERAAWKLLAPRRAASQQGHLTG